MKYVLLPFLFLAAQHSPHVVPVVPEDLLSRPTTIRVGIGKVHDAVTTKSAEAQAFYDQGLAYLDSYVWIEAARSFHQALRIDPALVMAQVGLSVAYVELNKPVEARRFIEAARAKAATASSHERRHIEARALQMDAEDSPADQAKLVKYRQALDAAIGSFPQDAEFLLARGIAESPDPADRGQGSVTASIPFYERALRASPNHFAAKHFLAHAYENTARMPEALANATAYATAAPQVPHALHMHGHELRRAGKPLEAIAEFEKADKIQRDYFAREKVDPSFDWHHQHNMDLLAASYQYVGQMKKAEALLKQSFAIPSNLLTQVVNKREWPEFLIARGRYEEAMGAAQTLSSHPNPIVQATGQIEQGFIFLATKRFAEAANASNSALRLMRTAPGGQIAAIQLEQLQGEFNLRTAQRDKGRQGMQRAAEKLRSLPGPDNWSQSLFRLEAMARTARDVGDWQMAGLLAQMMTSHDPAYAGTHYAAALVAEHDGNGPTAKREFALAVTAWTSADPDLPELAEARKRR